MSFGGIADSFDFSCSDADCDFKGTLAELKAHKYSCDWQKQLKQEKKERVQEQFELSDAKRKLAEAIDSSLEKAKKTRRGSDWLASADVIIRPVES